MTNFSLYYNTFYDVLLFLHSNVYSSALRTKHYSHCSLFYLHYLSTLELQFFTFLSFPNIIILFHLLIVLKITFVLHFLKTFLIEHSISFTNGSTINLLLLVLLFICVVCCVLLLNAIFLRLFLTW